MTTQQLIGEIEYLLALTSQIGGFTLSHSKDKKLAEQINGGLLTMKLRYEARLKEENAPPSPTPTPAA